MPLRRLALLTLSIALPGCTGARGDDYRVAVIKFQQETCTFCPGGDAPTEDWTRLGFVLIRGTAMILEGGSADGRPAEEEAECRSAEALLREKYSQYETVPLGGPDSLFIRITLERATSWGMI